MMYNINIETYDNTKTYTKNNLIIYNDLLYQANKDTRVGDFDINDWNLIVNQQKTLGEKFVVNFLNLETDEIPPQDLVKSGDFIFCKNLSGGNNEYLLYKYNGSNWIPVPINSYKNLSVYLLNDTSYYYKNITELYIPLKDLTNKDLVHEITFDSDPSLPLNQSEQTSTIIFSEVKIEFSKNDTDDWLVKLTTLDNNNSTILINKEKKAINNFNNAALNWNIGKRTLTFKKKQNIIEFDTVDGSKSDNIDVPSIGAFTKFKNNWTINNTVKTVLFNGEGDLIECINYEEKDLIKKLIMGTDILTVDENNTINLQYADSANKKSGIVSYQSNDIKFDDGKMIISGSFDQTVKGTFDFAYDSEIPDSAFWTNLENENKLVEGSTLVDLNVKKIYERSNNHTWEETGALSMSDKQCIFIDNHVSKNELDDLVLLSSVVYKKENGFKKVVSNPITSSNRQVVNNFIYRDSDADVFENILINLENVIDDVQKIQSVYIEGVLSYTVYSQPNNDDNTPSLVNIAKFEKPFKTSSLHSEMIFTESLTNDTNRLFYGLTNHDVENQSHSSNYDLNQIYFILEPVGYVKSVSVTPNYVPFYVPTDILPDTFMRGIKLSVDPPTGDGNVNLFWDFGVLAAEDTNMAVTGLGLNNNIKGKSQLAIRGKIIVTYDY